MALPVINIIFTPAQIAAISAAMDALEANCAFRVNIPANDKNDEQAMNVKRYPYVKKVIEDYAPTRPDLQPAFMPLPDAQNDFTLYNQFSPMISRLAAILESYIDTQWLGGAEGHAYFLEFYAQVERAKNRNVPGADAIYQDLKRLFEEQGTPPVTPP